MHTPIKLVLVVMFIVFGLWLTAREPLPGAGIPNLWNCAGSRALICIQK
jgi:L-asparagine transporter-like permease